MTERAEAARLVDLGEQEVFARAPADVALGAGGEGEPLDERLGEGPRPPRPAEGQAALLVERLEEGHLLVAVAGDERLGERAEPVVRRGQAVKRRRRGRSRGPPRARASPRRWA